MSDSISRQAAVDAMGKIFPKSQLTYVESVKALEAIPPAGAVQEWIPVSDRLPEKAGMHIVTRGQDGFEEDGKATWAIFDTAKKKFYYPGERVNYYINVTAWMPLPEPYREVEE